ncbi:hypothetical protein SB781_36920, partial [Paraburkholderia sp. SIMBA_061]
MKEKNFLTRTFSQLFQNIEQLSGVTGRIGSSSGQAFLQLQQTYKQSVNQLAKIQQSFTQFQAILQRNGDMYQK